jgi:4a-hydroxytetrahydrobiopterin dehydratase
MRPERLEPEQINSQLKTLNGWNLRNSRLSKDFVFSDFKEAFSVMTRIAFEAERLNHHPDWKNVYNRLEIELFTHDLQGLSALDFEFAQSIDRITESSHNR